MAFFRNDTVNLLNLHYGVHQLAISGGGAFLGAFLLKAGVPAPMVLASLAAIIGGRFLVRPAVLPAAKRWGLKRLVIAGTLVAATEYPLLAKVQGVDVWLAALIAVSSIGDALYWTTYHAYFASLGDAEHRGHQIGAREAIGAAAGVVGPLAGGWALASFGPMVAFGVTGAVMALSALPIVFAPDTPVVAAAPGALRAAIPGILLFAGDGCIAAGILLAWPIALFVALGRSYTAFGGAMALAALAGAVAGMLLGRFIDAGHGVRAVWLAGVSLVVTTLARAAAYRDPAGAVLANAVGALIPALYTPTLMTAVYNQAKVSPCALRFHLATEGGWDAGGAAGLLAAAGLLWAGAPIWTCILLTLIGTVANTWLLRRYYARAADGRLVQAESIAREGGVAPP
jgi:hypothetical protein